MISIQNKIAKFLKEEDGPTAVEYAVMLALIMLACIGSVGLVGSGANNLWGGNLRQILTSFGN